MITPIIRVRPNNENLSEESFLVKIWMIARSNTIIKIHNIKYLESSFWTMFETYSWNVSCETFWHKLLEHNHWSGIPRQGSRNMPAKLGLFSLRLKGGNELFDSRIFVWRTPHKFILALSFLAWICLGCTSRGSCNNMLLRRVRRLSNSKCFLEGFLEGRL